MKDEKILGIEKNHAMNPHTRITQLLEKRTAAAIAAGDEEKQAFPHKTNGDEALYANQAYAGNFSKTLPHDPQTALVDPSAYHALLHALRTGTLAAFDRIPRGGADALAGPLSPLMFQMEGEDAPAALSDIVPPSVASAGGAAEMVEIYWEAYLRDVPFIDYGSNPLVAQAAADMNRLSAYAGPTPVTPQNLFRYPFIGCTDGPYVSQFLYQTHSLDGALYVPMIHSRLQVADPVTGNVLPATTSPGVDYMTSLAEYVSVENGNGAFNAPNDPPNASIDPTARFVRSCRDLGSLAASDAIFSIYFRAAIFLQNMGIPTDPNMPYNLDTTKRITGFNTFSTAWLFSLLGRVHATEAAAFYQKWYVHRKVRPEAHANLVDGILTHRFTLTPSMHPELLNSAVLPLIVARNRQLNVKRGVASTADSFFCPQELNAGSPSHPSSPAGHAFTAGACVTLLKAFFDLGVPGNLRPWPTTAPNPFVPFQPACVANTDGCVLVPTEESDLTILGELNKLAANISEGRNMSGIHWRVSDNMLGMLLGENVAIYLLNETAALYPEPFKGFTLTKFDGTTILVGGNS
jgi:hypothetical protein